MNNLRASEADALFSVLRQSADADSVAAIEALARISHRIECIEAANQRKLLCHNDLSMIRGAPRCRQTVPRISSNLNPSKGGK